LKEFDRLEKEIGNNPNPPTTPVDEATQLSLGTLQGYFVSHPPAEQRMEQIKALMHSEHWPEPPLRPLICHSDRPEPPSSSGVVLPHKEVMVWQHGESHWKDLHSYCLRDQEGIAFDHLAEIVPESEVDAWDDLVLNQPMDNGEMRAFCRWLPTLHAEALRMHFHYSDRDWRECAYHNYLAKSPEAILRHHWRRFEDLPIWQARLLDRRLFAPEAVRPAPLVEDRQRMISDMRMKDPFDS
jgi:hypothetical protein